MKLTEEQQAITDAELDNVTVVTAFAGSGKTSSLISFCEARTNYSILYMAYNKGLATESRGKFSHMTNVQVKTMHALAFAKKGHEFKNRLGNLRPFDLLPYCRSISESGRYFHASVLLQLIREFCHTAFTMKEYREYLIENKEEFKLKHKFRVDFFEKNIEQVWEDIHTNEDVKYEHDFYLKNYQLDSPVINYDYILIDEAQDLNGCVVDILEKQKSKKLFIGDAHQSIYAFRGASNFFANISKKENIKTFSLTQSFRCPNYIADHVNRWFKILGEKGKFKGVDIKETPIDPSGVIAYIARTNATIFEKAVDHAVKQNKVLYFVGGISGYNFRDLIDMQLLSYGERKDIKNQFIKKFSSYSQLEEYAKEAFEVDLLSKIKIVDKFLSTSIEALVDQINKNTTTVIEEADSVFTTAHKAKGLEWENVEIIDDFLNIRGEMLTPDGKEKDNTVYLDRQELNLIYVAMTRSKKSIEIPYSLKLDDEWIKRNSKKIVVVDPEELKKLRKKEEAEKDKEEEKGNKKIKPHKSSIFSRFF